MLIDAILSFLPELVWDVVISKTLTVEHDHLEEVFDAELYPHGLSLERALLGWVVRMPRDSNDVFVLHLLDSLRLLHLVLGVGTSVLANQHLVIQGLNSQLDPLDQVDGLVGKVCECL